jgi:hypothetical protein
MIKATFFIEVATTGANGVNLKFTRKIPFVPCEGFMMTVAPGDDHRRVESVYWSEEDGLQIFFEFEEGYKPKLLKTFGWVSAD